ncbi:MAG TPA: flippase activity-associated protein Agl23, partial [Verrucomicrobiae bacterium]|nr:flippase activity-associated protein Agl23 [Verrucomicrobiae bacterium]
GLILLLPLLADGLGKSEALCAGVLTAISSAMVFYSRYFIHEMLLVFFTGLLVATGWRYWSTRRIRWCLLAGASLGLMHATKETFVLAAAALAGALVCTFAWGRCFDGRKVEIRIKQGVNVKHVVAAPAVAVLVSVIFFSSFFTNASGPLDSVRTYLPWLSRAGGNSPHNHPWYFYLQRLAFFRSGNGPIWSEGLILLLAGIGLISALWRRTAAPPSVVLVRVIGFYTVLLTLIYTVISYKTPWCFLGFLHGMILLAGVGAMAAIRFWRHWLPKVATAAALVAATAHLGGQAWRASYVYAADRKNPYVYAQTSPDIRNLVEKVEAIARVHPQASRMLIKVMAADRDYWPLPWYLRRFKQVGWWDRIPADPLAPVMIVSSRFGAAFDERPDKTHLMAGYFQLRPQVFLELYVEIDLWRAYIQSLPPKQDGDARVPLPEHNGAEHRAPANRVALNTERLYGETQHRGRIMLNRQ